MKFIIKKIILWPKKEGFNYREVTFEENKVNIITGASRTGKSALIPIVDYCLGSDKCNIPVDKIRNACAWFGVLVQLENEQLLLCRREPGKQIITGDMFLLRAKEVKIPNQLTTNINVEQVKNILNELFGFSFLPLNPSNPKNYSARPSYRDFMAFLFQPQNIVANADVLFYKADTIEHRQRLINLFPYSLGAITAETLAAQQELERLKKIRDRVQNDLNVIKNVSIEWQEEANGWLIQAKELGLIAAIPNESMKFEDKVEILSQILDKSYSDSFVESANVNAVSDSVASLQERERRVSSELFALQKRRTNIKSLKNSANQYESALSIQVQRLQISKWLKEQYDKEHVCPFCKSEHQHALEELNVLCQAIEKIENSANTMQTMPATFEREIQVLEKEIVLKTEELQAIQKRLVQEMGNKQNHADKKYTLSSIQRFLGRIEETVKIYSRLGKNEELQNKLLELNSQIEQLKRLVNEAEIQGRISAALAYINQSIGEIIKRLDVENPDDPVSFIIKDLTIKVKSESGRDDYLWEIGSASNWLAYHVAVILSFQKFFQNRKNLSIPNFLFIDQPSQVYFPQKSDGNIEIKDEDKQAVKMIFETFSKFIRDNNYSTQIIVTEHADEDIWGGIQDSHLVEKWRGENKLVPVEWI